jgi:Short C-terminal domain
MRLEEQTLAEQRGTGLDLVRNTGGAIGDLLRRMGITSDVAGGALESSQTPVDALDQLKKLAELRESDAITPAEYAEHKQKLLAKLARDIAK